MNNNAEHYELFLMARAAYQSLKIPSPDHISLCHIAPPDYSYLRGDSKLCRKNTNILQTSIIKSLLRCGAEVLTIDTIRLKSSKILTFARESLMDTPAFTKIAAETYYLDPVSMAELLRLAAANYHSMAAAHQQLLSLPPDIKADYSIVSHRLHQFFANYESFEKENPISPKDRQNIIYNLYPTNTVPPHLHQYMVANSSKTMSFLPEYALSHFHQFFVPPPKETNKRQQIVALKGK